jgi:hypothetical protein
MANIPLPVPRPDYFDDRFAIPVQPQWRSGTMEAAQENLRTALEQYARQMQIKKVLNEPFYPNYNPENMPLSVVEEEVDPVEMPDIKDPWPAAYDHFRPMLPREPNKLDEIGFWNAINPLTFMKRYNEAVGVQPSFESRWDQRIKGNDDQIPQVDEADEMVKNELDKQAD